MLRQVRKSRNLSTRKLAEASGVPKRTIETWEFKGVEHATAGNLKKVADVLGVKIDDLLEGDTDGA